MEVPDNAYIGPDAGALTALEQEPSLELSERSDSSKALVAQDRAPSARTGIGNPARGAAPLIAHDEQKVEEAAAWISAKVAATLRRGAQEVGKYLLEHFFSDDLELARSRNPCKNISFRRLAEKCGTPALPISKTWLNNAVGVALTLRRLPETAQAFRALPPSYQETLLPLRDPLKIERLAQQAVARALSFRELRDVVAEERGRRTRVEVPSPQAGPSVVKAINVAARMLASTGSSTTDIWAELASLDGTQRGKLKASVEEVMVRLKDVLGHLG